LKREKTTRQLKQFSIKTVRMYKLRPWGKGQPRENSLASGDHFLFEASVKHKIDDCMAKSFHRCEGWK
jgi:hypothetical protein